MLRRRHQYALIAFILTSASGQSAKADGCPSGTTQIGERTEETTDSIIVHPICREVSVKSVTVPNLDTDPNGAPLSAAQLRVVDRRIVNVQKAIALLGKSNPEWAEERRRVFESMREDAVELSWEGVNLLSLGLTELEKAIAEAHLSDMHINALSKAFSEPLKTLPSEESRLNRIMATTQDPALTKSIIEYATAVHRLRDAEHSKDAVSMVARVRDAAETLKSEFEAMKAEQQPADVAEGLYMSSAFVGQAALVFVAEGPEAVTAAAGSAMSSLAVGGRELVNLWQERGQLVVLNQNAADRDRMRVELLGRLDDLHEQHERLVWAIQHAGRAVSAH